MSKIFQELKDHLMPSAGNQFRPRVLSRAFLISLVLLVCVIQGFLITSLTLSTRSSQFSAAVLKSALISFTNTARADVGEPALRTDPLLTKAAQAKAEDMASRGYFSHVDPSGKEAWDWMREAGYDYAYAGENLAADFFDSSSVVHAWLSSPSHRRNVMSTSYQDVGIGVARGTHEGREAILVVQLFGTTKKSLGLMPPTAAAAEGARSAHASSSVSSENAQAASSEVITVHPEVLSHETGWFPGTFAGILSSPRTVALWVLSVFFALVLSAVALAFFIRIQVQAPDMLLGGLVVAAFLMTLIASNGYFFGSVDLPSTPAAASIATF